MQKLDGDIATTVAGGNGAGPALNQIKGNALFVVDDGVLYICDGNYAQPGVRAPTTASGHATQ